MIETLRMKGFRVGIDDFGSGYFSFHDLMNLSIDFVKLDKQFVDSLDQQENHRQMIQHIIGMLKDKGCQITIEGIETESQFAAWKALEVDLVQGYYIAKPMPVKQLKRWMHKG
jgi:EAL domain-containing protein (putative c-di-GMP-specific phosphodiesterase class I)